MNIIAALGKSHLVDLLTERAAQHPERVALRFVRDAGDPEVLSYAQLHERSVRLAAVLAERSAPGERALLLYPSGIDYVTALLACFHAGIVAVPAYPPQSLQARHVERILGIARDARPALLLTNDALHAPLTSVQSQYPELAGTQLMAATVNDAGGAVPYAPRRAVRAEDLALLQYTSGSTSAPKGVMLTHANLMANEATIHDAFSIQPEDVIVSWLPLFHDMGLIGTLLQPLYAGVSAVLMATPHFMQRPRRWLEAISRYGGTVSGAPDFAYRLCAERLEAQEGEVLDLSSWRLAFCGAEPVRAQTLRAFADKFAAVGFERRALYPCYGLAEATLIVSGGERGGGVRDAAFEPNALRAHRAVLDSAGQKLVSCGVARLTQHVVIVDVESGAVLPEGSVGEIQVAGPSIARGYWEKPEVTAQTFVERGGEHFLRTGDLGFLAGGELFVTGRCKDLIIVRGQNLYPHDIERAIESENTIVRAGRVVAFACEHGGQEGVAVAAEINPRMLKLVVAPNVCRELVEVVARNFGESPLVVLLLKPGSVPITSSGKLQRSLCKQQWLAGELTVIASHGPAAGAGARDETTASSAL